MCLSCILLDLSKMSAKGYAADIYLSLCFDLTAAISSVITLRLLRPENAIFGCRASLALYLLVQSSANHPDKKKRELFSGRV